jgi:hypothetical protein
MHARGQVAVVLVVITAALAACGDEDEKRYGDAKIVDQLNLEEIDIEGKKELAINRDPFCLVSELLNTRSEVDDADGEAPIVVASREGNVGIAGVEIVPDCQEKARKKLNKLDPVGED